MLDARVDRLEAALARLADAQAQTQADLRQLAQRIDQLAEAQRRTEEHLASLVQQVTILGRDVGDLKGESVERRYRDHADAYFAPLMDRLHVLSVAERSALLADARTAGGLAEHDLDELRWADIIVQGRSREGAEVFGVVEVSSTIDTDDVYRAARRAAVTARATGRAALAVVAGLDILPAAADACRAQRVWQVIDGRATPPPDT